MKFDNHAITPQFSVYHHEQREGLLCEINMHDLIDERAF